MFDIILKQLNIGSLYSCCLSKVGKNVCIVLQKPRLEQWKADSFEEEGKNEIIDVQNVCIIEYYCPALKLKDKHFFYADENKFTIKVISK